MNRIKTLFIAGFVLAIGTVFAVEAQNLPPDRSYIQALGNVQSDTLTWFASGDTIPGANVRVDTLIEAGVDTTYPFPIHGSESVLVEILTREAGSDSLDVVYFFQVGSSPDKTAMWHTLNTTHDTTPTGAESANDTIAVLLQGDGLNASVVDTSAALAAATAETGMIVPAFGDRALVRAMRYGRIIAVQTADTGADTNLVTAIVTRRYPR